MCVCNELEILCDSEVLREEFQDANESKEPQPLSDGVAARVRELLRGHDSDSATRQEQRATILRLSQDCARSGKGLVVFWQRVAGLAEKDDLPVSPACRRAFERSGDRLPAEEALAEIMDRASVGLGVVSKLLEASSFDERGLRKAALIRGAEAKNKDARTSLGDYLSRLRKALRDRRREDLLIS